jgi:glycopeptide antibiotics resistance protein
MKLSHLRDFFVWTASDEAPYFVFSVMFIFYAACILLTIFVTLIAFLNGFWMVPVIAFFAVPLTIAYMAYRKRDEGDPS